MSDIQNSPVRRALSVFDGSPTKLANAIDPTGERVKRQHVEHWLKAERIPTEHVRAVERLTGVPAWDFRPVDWHLIWPELIGSEGAPAVPQQPETTQEA